jgi:hypothetical protein
VAFSKAGRPHYPKSAVAVTRFKNATKATLVKQAARDEFLFLSVSVLHARRPMKTVLVVSLLFVAHAGASWKEYRHLVRSDDAVQRSAPARGVRITYLGTNGYLFESKDATLLVDPYFFADRNVLPRARPID